MTQLFEDVPKLHHFDDEKLDQLASVGVTILASKYHTGHYYWRCECGDGNTTTGNLEPNFERVFNDACSRFLPKFDFTELNANFMTFKEPKEPPKKLYLRVAEETRRVIYVFAANSEHEGLNQSQHVLLEPEDENTTQWPYRTEEIEIGDMEKIKGLIEAYLQEENPPEFYQELIEDAKKLYDEN